MYHSHKKYELIFFNCVKLILPSELEKVLNVSSFLIVEATYPTLFLVSNALYKVSKNISIILASYITSV